MSDAMAGSKSISEYYEGELENKKHKFSHASLFANTKFNRKHAGSRRTPFSNMHFFESKSVQAFNERNSFVIS